jgi:ADP-dependent NAD(P)H-hydrate dehydratase / NAD(P)H-hydrate epimerase
MPSPILSVAQMRAWEQATWQAGQLEEAVIARVGQLVAERASRRTHAGDRLLLLAGKGHNGDDVRQARPHMNDRLVELLEITDPVQGLPQLVKALDARPSLVVDGLFGIGLNRPLDDGWKRIINLVNQANLRVLAVDAPSGLNCDTGQPEGAAIKAGLTLTLGAVKRGLVQSAAAKYVGRLELATDIGLIECPLNSDLCWTRAEDFAGFPPARRCDSHKGSFGHVVILAGSLGYHGAAVLAARGAQAARPGLITVVTTDGTYLPVAVQLQSVMVRPWTVDWELPDRTTAILFGPGLADASVPTGLRKQALHFWQQFSGAVVADASGLDWLAPATSPAPGIRVITPHPGEAARLLDTPTAQVQADRLTALRKLSARYGGCRVTLKGHQTLIGGASAEVFVNSTGGPRLAQGGSGDVLAGYLAGLLAQPALQDDPMLTLRYAVWRHGLAGESPNWTGLIDDLPVELAAPHEIDGLASA